jgi:flavin reductase (DIM6/NTAB) family NADH-FMN oxidoreductase RutF
MAMNDSRKFRDTLGCFTTGVTVVATLDNAGQPRGITVSSFASVSLEPPMILCCVANNAQCASAFRESDHFSVNILTASQRLLSSRFAQRTENKWHGLEFDTWTSGVPILRDCLANLECRKVEDIDAGDHRILVGLVLGLAQRSDEAPLIYYRGAYERIEQKAVAVEATPIAFAEPRQACGAG